MNIFFLERLFPDAAFQEGDKEIIQSIMDMINNHEKLGIRMIAEKNFTSPSSISRLSKRAGFSNFREFLFHLKSKIDAADYGEVANVSFAKSNRDASETNYILTKVFSSQVIYLFGEGFCEPVIDYTYRKMLQSQLMCVNLSGLEIGLLDNSQTVALLVVSQSGENKHGLSKIHEIQAQDGMVIAFTANENSSFAKKADLCYVIDAGNWVDADNTTLNYFYGHTINLLEYIIDHGKHK